MEFQEPGEIGEDQNELVDLQGKPMAGKCTPIDIQDEVHVNRESEETAGSNDGVQHKEPKVGKPKDGVRQKEPLMGKEPKEAKPKDGV